MDQVRLAHIIHQVSTRTLDALLCHMLLCWKLTPLQLFQYVVRGRDWNAISLSSLVIVQKHFFYRTIDIFLSLRWWDDLLLKVEKK